MLSSLTIFGSSLTAGRALPHRDSMLIFISLYSRLYRSPLCFFFFLNDPPPTEISPLPLHDALPIPLGVADLRAGSRPGLDAFERGDRIVRVAAARPRAERRHVIVRERADHRQRVPRGPEREQIRSEEHTSELQSQSNLVCRLLLEKK